MSSKLVEDFINNTVGSNNDVKEIPMDEIDNEKILRFDVPTEQGYLEIDMHPLDTQSAMERSIGFTRLIDNKREVFGIIHKLSRGEEVDNIYDFILNTSNNYQLPTEFCTGKNKAAEALAMSINVLYYIDACIAYLYNHYDVQFVDDAGASIPTADDTEDEHLQDMLNVELNGGTDGVPFTNEELYGE